jgi:hypothetical protein
MADSKARTKTESNGKSIAPKPVSDFFRAERNLWVVAVAILAVLLIFWGYTAFTALFGAYKEAHNPTEEQVGVHILQVQRDLFDETLEKIQSRKLY